MRFVVCVKLTPDTEQLAEIKPEGVTSGDLGVTMVLNPWDEFAVEEALQLQDRYGGETVAITAGGEDSVEALKRAVAMGIEEPVLLCDEAFAGSDAWSTAHILAEAIKARGEYSLILTGRQSVDGNSGLVAPGLAAKLGVPFISAVSKILDVSEACAVVQRTLDEGVQTLRVPLPAVLSVSKEINEPRYPNFMGIRKASKMQYPKVGAADLPGLELSRIGANAARVEWASVRKPPKRVNTCEMVTGGSPAEQAARLAEKLIADKLV